MTTDPKIPAQSQDSMPADEHAMDPAPDWHPRHPGTGKLDGKVALITGGDSGIGRAVAALYAREGARVAIAYLEEDRDAERTKEIVEDEGSECLLIPGDLGVKANASAAVERTAERFGGLDILVNNGAQQWIDDDLAELSEDRLRRMMDSNVLAYFFATQAALPHLKEGARIVNTSSVNAFAGMGSLIAYSTTRGASLAFTRSLAANLAERKINVNAVAPGPIWTPVHSRNDAGRAGRGFRLRHPHGPRRATLGGGDGLPLLRLLGRELLHRSDDAPERRDGRRRLSRAGRGRTPRPGAVARGATGASSRRTGPARTAQPEGRRVTLSPAPSDRPLRGGWSAAPIIYEVYPRSFLDTTGNGEGDLAGVAAKLDHVAALGAEAVWLAPFFLSPMLDGGYDVQDHTVVNPRFGTDADFDALVLKAHSLGLKVMIDQVLNHTSHRHAWFANSVERRGGYDDWYVWRDPKPDGSPPNNWLSQFGPPAWSWNHRRRQYYMHQFLDCQPNLNLRNEAVKAELRRQLRGWKDRGIDGFRLDAITSYLWDESFADNPPADADTRARIAGPEYNPYSMQDHRNDMLPGDGVAFAPVVREWAGDDVFLLGEITSGNRSVELLNGLCAPDGLDAAYTVDLTERGVTPEIVLDVLQRQEAQRSVAWWLSSHDQARAATAQGDGSARDARFLGTLCALMPGPWMIYQGEELGLPQPYLDFDENTDPFDRMYWPDVPGREGPRVPIPWAEGYVGFGFTSGRPWLPMRWEGAMSVLAQEADEGSTLHYWRRLVAARRAHGIGEADVVSAGAEGDVLTVELASGSARMTSLMNFGPMDASLPAWARGDPIVASTPTNDVLPARTAAIWRREG